VRAARRALARRRAFARRRARPRPGDLQHPLDPAVAALASCGLPERCLPQDDRDAVATALTARLHAAGESRRFGAIVVPDWPPGQRP
jgi:hypothetical protein